MPVTVPEPEKRRNRARGSENAQAKGGQRAGNSRLLSFGSFVLARFRVATPWRAGEAGVEGRRWTSAPLRSAEDRACGWVRPAAGGGPHVGTARVCGVGVSWCVVGAPFPGRATPSSRPGPRRDPPLLQSLDDIISCSGVPHLAPAGGTTKMSTAKEDVRRLLDQLPDDVSLEDVQYHIYVRQKSERALKEVQDGCVLSQEEVERRMARWLE
jgi:hypothetical protein